MKPLIKWPGGKSSEIKYIEKMLPKFDRYVEPFFGGGALYFDLMPKKAVINDISDNLINFYRLIKENDLTFKRYLIEYNELWENLKSNASVCVEEIVPEYLNYRNNKVDDLYMEKLLSNHVAILLDVDLSQDSGHKKIKYFSAQQPFMECSTSQVDCQSEKNL